jgi:hypothetical protein
MTRLLIETQGRPSRRSIVQWVTVFLLSVSGLITSLTGIYFLVLPSGGYQGGRNPHYGETFLFDRDIWTALHTWAGLVMVTVVLFHLALHWRWVAEMGKRTLAIVFGKRKPFIAKIWARVGIIGAISGAFLVVAASGVYFFAVPGGNHRGSAATQFLLSRSTWSDLHTWVGLAMIIFAIVHLALRWKWVARVTPNIMRTAARRRPKPAPSLPSYSKSSQ